MSYIFRRGGNSSFPEEIVPMGTSPLSFIAITLVVVAAYYLTGKIGLSLAIPPGYATLFWPPAGIALAAVLLCGYRAAIGIAIGSFLVNWELSVHIDSPMGIATGLPMLIGLGAALQAILGAILVHCRAGFPNPFNEPIQVVRLIGWGGGVACLFNPVWSVFWLWAIGGLVPTDSFYNIFTWWAGDALGVCLFTPHILAWLIRPRIIWLHRRWTITLSLVACFAITCGLVGYTANQEYHQLSEKFSDKSSIIFNDVNNRLHNYVRFINISQELIAHTDTYNHDFSIHYGELIRRNYPGILSIHWIPLQDEHSAFADGSEFVESFVDFSNEEIRSIEEARHIAEQRARETGTLSAESVPPRDKQSSNMNRRIQVASNTPGYSSLGTISILLGFPETLQDIFNKAQSENIICWFTDEDSSILLSNSAHIPTISHPLRHGLFGGNLILWQRAEIQFGGRRFVLQTAPSVGFMNQSRMKNIWMVLATGLLFTNFLGLFMVVTSGQMRTLEKLVTERTRELQQQESSLLEHNEALAQASVRDVMRHLEAVLVNSPVGLAIISPERIIMRANRAFGEVFGTVSSEIIGQSSRILFSSHETFEKIYHLAFPRIMAGEIFSDVVQMQRHDGQDIWVRLSGRLVDPAEPSLGITWTAEDRTSSVQAEADLRITNERFHLLIDSLPNEIAVLDQQGNVLLSNAKWQQAIGGNEKMEESLDTSYAIRFQKIDSLNRDIYSTIDCSINAILSNRLPSFSIDYSYDTTDGIRWFNLEVLSLCGDNTGALISHTDITGQRQAEEIRRESHDFYEQLFKGTAAVKLLIDPMTTVIADANPAAVDFYGYPLEKLRGLPLEYINRQSREQLIEAMKRVLEQGQAYFSFRHQLANGTLREVEVETGGGMD